MNEHDLKSEAAIRAERDFKPEPLIERLEKSDKLLEDSLVLATLIHAALVSASSLESPHRPIANVRDMVELSFDRVQILHMELNAIASVLGV